MPQKKQKGLREESREEKGESREEVVEPQGEGE
jgi:hypothetical protein